MRRGHPTLTDELLDEFIEELAENGGIVSRAAKHVGVSRVALYAKRNANMGFAKRWAEAINAGTDVLEEEAFRRAVEGTDRPVYYQGIECGHIREYSDKMLELLLKSRRPHIFREKLAEAPERDDPGIGTFELVDDGYAPGVVDTVGEPTLQ